MQGGGWLQPQKLGKNKILFFLFDSSNWWVEENHKAFLFFSAFNAF